MKWAEKMTSDDKSVTSQQDEDEAATMTKTRSRPNPLRCADERRNLQDPIGGSFLAKASDLHAIW